MVDKYLKGEGEKLFTGEFQGGGQGASGGRLGQGEGGWVGKMCRRCCQPEYIINPLTGGQEIWE